MTWYDTDYSFKKKITIDHTKVSGDETDFPVLISVTDNDLRDEANSGHVKSSNGYDIIFTNSAENAQLNHEIERYVNTSGLLVFWVKVSSLSSSSDTDIYIYYGKSGVVADPSSTSTWDSGFKAVFHLDETAGDAIDSTANSNDGTYVGDLPDRVTGKIGYGQDFDGTGDYITLPAGAYVTTIGTVEVWTESDNPGDWRQIWHSYDDANNYINLQYDGSMDIYSHGRSGGNVQWDMNVTGTGTTFHYASLAWTTNDTILTRNATTTATDNACTMAAFTPISSRIGCNEGGNVPFDGVVDECRISNVRRSNNWMETTYNTQNDASAFMSWGSEEQSKITHTPSDSVSISDIAAFKRKMNLSDTTSISDNILFEHKIELLDVISISDNMLLKRLLALVDTVNLSDTMLNKRLLSLYDSVNITDDILLKHLINLADTLNITDDTIFKHTITLTDLIQISDDIIYKHLLNLIDSVNISDIVTFKRLLNLDDSISVTDNIVYKHLVTLVDTIGINEELILKHFISLLDTINIDESIQMGHFISIYSHVDITDSITFKYSLFFLDNISILDDMSFDMTDVCGDVFNVRSSTYSIYLPMPEMGGETGTLNNELKLFDFWAGERDTTNIGIANEPITLSGTIYACTNDEEVEMTAIAAKFSNIHEMMDNCEEVTITELGDCFDAVYVIKDFKYGTIGHSPYAYTWQLTLEYVRSI